MTNCLDNITRTSFTLGTDHGGTFADTTQSLAKITAPAHKWHFKVVLVNVVFLICRSKNFTLIDVVNINSLQDLSLDKVTNTAFGHNRNSYGINDLLDHSRVRHTRDTTISTNISRHAFQSHNSTCASFFGDARLLSIHHVHDNTTL